MTTPKWRVGRTLGRTLYLQTGEEPSKVDTFLGIMDTRDMANFVVVAVNNELQMRRARQEQ